MATKQKKTQKMSAKQRQARLEAAQAREQAALEEKERKEFLKRIGIGIVAVLLIMGLMLPMTALSFCGSQQMQQAATTTSSDVAEATSAATSAAGEATSAATSATAEATSAATSAAAEATSASSSATSE